MLRMVFECLTATIRLVRRERIDIIHAGSLFVVGSVAWLLKKLLHRPYVVYAYGEELNVALRRTHSLRGGLLRALYRSIIVQSDGLIAVSDYTMGLLETLGGRRHMMRKVLPMIVTSKLSSNFDRREVRAKYGLTPERPVILGAGRLIERKGFDFLIRSVPRVLADVPDAVFVIAGQGPDEARLRNLAREELVNDRVVFAGFVSDNDLSSLYEICDVFAMPHRELPDGDTEGCPTVFLEANAHGKPVVGGKAGGVEDAILDGETGFIVDGTRVEEVAAAIVRLLCDRDLARELGERGRQRVLEELTPSRGAEKVMAFCREIVQDWARQ
jgi:phosphatidylinositol alpha-1,6-mannosyltransferase